jgi:hypothetical protein
VAGWSIKKAATAALSIWITFSVISFVGVALLPAPVPAFYNQAKSTKILSGSSDIVVWVKN